MLGIGFLGNFAEKQGCKNKKKRVSRHGASWKIRNMVLGWRQGPSVHGGRNVSDRACRSLKWRFMDGWRRLDMGESAIVMDVDAVWWIFKIRSGNEMLFPAGIFIGSSLW